jgi:hypothetical protein
MKRILLILLTTLFIFSCAGQDKMIEPDQNTGDIKLTCMQETLKDHKMFQKSFKFNQETPEVTVYAKGAYANLSEENKDAALESIGRQWQACYPDDFRPMTLWLKDVHDMIITVIFVTKE